MSADCWKEFPQTIGLGVRECKKKWEKPEGQICLRGDQGGKRVPAFYLFPFWLASKKTTTKETTKKHTIGSKRFVQKSKSVVSVNMREIYSCHMQVRVGL